VIGPPPPPPPIAFTVAVEEFVAEVGPPLSYAQLGRVVGSRHATLLQLLGWPLYRARRRAWECLKAEGPAAWPALAWGERSGDAEVRRACRELTAPRYTCDNCRGRGVVSAHPTDPDTCWACDGTGDIRGREGSIR
jgi:hypothetical protein